MACRNDLIFCSGKISEEDKSWDIQFWQSSTTEERFRATTELLKAAYKIKTGKELPKTVDKHCIITGSYSND